MTLSAESIQSLLMISGMGIICWILIRQRLKRLRRTEPQVQGPRLGHNANAQRSIERYSGTDSLGAPPDVLKWQVELYELGRELKAELDTRMIAVRTLSKQYDQAAYRLSQLIKLAEQASRNVASDLPHEKRMSVIQQLRHSGWSHQRIADALQLPVEVVLQSAQAGNDQTINR